MVSKILDPSKIHFKTCTFFQRVDSNANRIKIRKHVEEFHLRFNFDLTIMCLNGTEVIQAGDNKSYEKVYEEWRKLLCFSKNLSMQK